MIGQARRKALSTPESFWEPQFPGDEYDPYYPPATTARIREWEARNNLRLPATLAEALTVHNGGRVRGIGIEVQSLEGFSILAESRWDDAFVPGNQEYLGFDGGDRSKLVLIGVDAGCGVVLDYRRGMEPSILVMIHDLGGVLQDPAIGTFDMLIGGYRR